LNKTLYLILLYTAIFDFVLYCQITVVSFSERQQQQQQQHQHQQQHHQQQKGRPAD